MKFMVGSEGVAMEVTQPECPLRVAVKVSWRLEDEVSMTLLLDTLDPGKALLYFGHYKLNCNIIEKIE